MMKCQDVRNYLAEYLEGEALPEISEAVSSHLAECVDCQQELEKTRRFLQSFSAISEEELPFDFKARLHERLEHEAKTVKKKPVSRRTWFRTIAAAAACLVLLVGVISLGGRVFSAKSTAPQNMMYDTAAYDTPAEAPMAASMMENAQADYDYLTIADGGEIDFGSGGSAPSGTVNSPPPEMSRKIIRDCYMTVKVDDFDSAYAQIESLAIQYGGYVVSGNTNNYEGSTSRNGYISIRVDAERLVQALEAIADLGLVENSNFSSQDVTSEYYDFKSRLEQYTAQQIRLLDMYDRAETVEELILLESELTRVNSEIDSIQGMLRYYDQMTMLSMITVDLHTPSTYTQTVEPKGFAGFWEKLSTGFLRGLNGVLDAISGIIVFLVSALPALIILAVLVVVAVLIVKSNRRNRRNKE